MIDFFLGLSIRAYWVALIGGTLGLFLLRLIVGVHFKLTPKQWVELLFLPLSLGYYRVFPERRPFQRIYEWAQTIVFVSTLIASIFVLYTHFG
jgi:hypothetical protein